MKNLFWITLFGTLNFWIIGEVFAQTPITVRKGATVTSPTGVRPVPDEIRNAPRVPSDNLVSGAETPDHIIYLNMFQQLILMSQTDGRQGVNCYGQPLSPIFQKNAKLSGKQYKELLKIANETQAKFSEIQEKAVTIIREFRAKTFSNPSASNERPAPPAELETLNNQRIELFAKAKERIKKNFGEKDFVRFSDFVDKNFRARTTTITLKNPI